MDFVRIYEVKLINFIILHKMICLAFRIFIYGMEKFRVTFVRKWKSSISGLKLIKLILTSIYENSCTFSVL